MKIYQTEAAKAEEQNKRVAEIQQTLQEGLATPNEEELLRKELEKLETLDKAKTRKK